jgi:para-nitrobenzyl esterase
MMGYWASFVRGEAPKAAGAPDWPAFTLADRGYLDSGERPRAAADLHPAAFAWADALVASRWKQGRGWRFDIGFSAFPTPNESGPKR